MYNYAMSICPSIIYIYLLYICHLSHGAFDQEWKVQIHPGLEAGRQGKTGIPDSGEFLWPEITEKNETICLCSAYKAHQKLQRIVKDPQKKMIIIFELSKGS